MAHHLLIVESPAKARTINKYLGKQFHVLASYGHVRDLIPKEGAVNPERRFAMTYQPIDRNAKHVEAIKKALRNADALYLATDPDREGEAISWHLCELLREQGALRNKPVHRVVFHEITQRAIKDAMDNPRTLSMDLINAQQARRALDYLVGFNLSPLLWRKVRRGLSAGRVQSPALRLIVERELAIEAFESQEYWTIEADSKKADKAFVARLTHFAGEKLEQFSITTAAHAAAVDAKLQAAAKGQLQVTHVEEKQRNRNPAAPFTTSTLQQEAVRKLGFTAQRTMRVAQQLYEGVDIGAGAVGLITYMRTDSVTLANEAVDDLRRYITQHYGADQTPDTPRRYANRSKNAQEAHEAVRPTAVWRHPDELKSALDTDQFKLYELIWRRAVACQMVPAVIATVAVDLAAGSGNTLRANGSTVLKPGFMVVYREDRDDAGEQKASDEKKLPPLHVGERVPLLAVRPEQHFTEPPPRYTEASLVRTLEEFGIGRPSTYASIISTLQQREYVEMDRKRFIPTDTGRVVSKFLTEHFLQYVDYDFTAELENQLDAVSRGELDWVPLMDRFWKPFKHRVDDKQDIERSEVAQARAIGTDPDSGKPVSVRLGRYGPFVQIGTREDDEKPRFAGLRAGQRLDTITLAEALELFKLPRDLGNSPAGEPLQVNIGRFGPYVKFGNQYASLKKDDDPYTLSHERALELVAAKKEYEANRQIRSWADHGIQILRGRWGPFITDGSKNAKIPKDREADSLTLAECQALLAAAPDKKGNVKKKAATKKKATVKKAATKKKTTAKKKKATAKSSTGAEKKAAKQP